MVGVLVDACEALGVDDEDLDFLAGGSAGLYRLVPDPETLLIRSVRVAEDAYLCARIDRRPNTEPLLHLP